MMNRKQFLRSMAGAGVGLVGVALLPGCSETMVEDDEALEELVVGCTPNAIISANHGHFVAVPGSHVVAGTERQYSIQGTSSHRHFITVTAEMFAALRAGQAISVVSGGTSHTHTVTIACMPFCDRPVTISANHGHAVVIPFFHVAQGKERQYSIQGTSAHRHFITLTPDHFATLRANMPVSVVSGGVSHTHTVTINCLAPDIACTPMPAISANHGHVLAITKEDIAAGFDREYNVQGTSTHPHTVLVTADMFEQLAQGMTVQTTATGGSHMHAVTITCPAAFGGLLPS